MEQANLPFCLICHQMDMNEKQNHHLTCHCPIVQHMHTFPRASGFQGRTVPLTDTFPKVRQWKTLSTDTYKDSRSFALPRDRLTNHQGTTWDNSAHVQKTLRIKVILIGLISTADVAH